MMLLEKKADFRLRALEAAHKICDEIGDRERHHAAFIENLIYQKMCEATDNHVDAVGDRFV